jgi:hypothetical protein
LKEVVAAEKTHSFCCFDGGDVTGKITSPLSVVEESFGQLVLLGYDVTTFTPVTYQRGSLPRPSKEVSSCG